MPWRALVARACGWKRDMYVPLTIVLNSEEQQHHACAVPAINAGFVRKDRLELLVPFDDLFQVTDEQVRMKPAFRSVDERTQGQTSLPYLTDLGGSFAHTIILSPSLSHTRSLVIAFTHMAEELKGEGVFRNWQNEMYAAKTSFGAATLFHYNRGVGTFFGLSQYATHLNGFVRSEDDNRVSHVWIAKRSVTKKQWPGRLDTIVGGGLPAHISSHDNMMKESEEEAGLDLPWVSAHLVSVGSIGYLLDERSGLANNIMFNYDLELPRSMEPVNRDGEVESFELWAVQDVVEALWDDPEKFKPDICLVLMDFFIRHGIFTPDKFPAYHELQLALRSANDPYEN